MPKKLLKYVEAITVHRDTALLDKSVITSLRELLNVQNIWLYDVAHKSDATLLALTTWSDDKGVYYRHDALTDEDYEPISSHPRISACIGPDGKVPATIVSTDPLHQVIAICVDHQLIACCEIHYTAPPSTHQKDLAKGILGLYRNYLSLLEDSQIDTLTGLHNRKTFERSLSRLLARSSHQAALSAAAKQRQERRRPLDKENWLVIIDIDHFKRINDQFGHLYGDEVLVLIAKLMRRVFRQNDQLFRFGGEEFVVLLRQVSYEAARNALERFRQKVSDHVFPQVGQITASAGFARISPQDLPNCILGHADEALYFAKDHGRNQVHCYETLIESGELSKRPPHTDSYLL